MKKPSVDEYYELLRGEGSTVHGRVEKQRQLSFKRTIEIAWNSIMVRIGRSLLVTSGIVLALAFLTYILCSDSLAKEIMRSGPAGLIDALKKQGLADEVNDANARIETYWMLGIALLVSFVGILNAMMLSVTERYKEIGTMKCLGALDGLVLELFLLESAFHGLLGTAIGIAAGLGLAYGEGLSLYGSVTWTIVPGNTILKLVALCFVVGIGLTITGALYPAWRASKMDPVVAMRSEA